MDEKHGLPIVPFASVEEWERWLAEHHLTSSGIWLKLAKKGTGLESVTYAEAVEIALCFGWIDGQKASFDELFWLQKLTPRGPRSPWSKINRGKALALLKAGRMKPLGLDAIERAKADGRWERAYEPQSTATVPDDLQRALEADPNAAAFFVTLDGTNRYAILYRIQNAKKPETRARRIEQLVAMLAERKKLYP